MCQQSRRSGFGSSTTSHSSRSIGSPSLANPQDKLSLKYQPLPLALWGTLDTPVSKITSARGAAARTVRVWLPVGPAASISGSRSHWVRMPSRLWVLSA